jgi:hypothetical protein
LIAGRSASSSIENNNTSVRTMLKLCRHSRHIFSQACLSFFFRFFSFQ